MTLIELLLVLFPLAGLWIGIAVGAKHGFWGGLAGGICGVVAGFLVYIVLGYCTIKLFWIIERLPGNRNETPDEPGTVWPPPPKAPDE